MKSFRYLALPAAVGGAAVLGMAPGAAFASDAGNSGSISNQVVAQVAAPVASSQTAGLIGSAISSAISGSISSVVPAGGNVVPGGVAPSGGLLNSRQMGKGGAGAAPKLGVWAQGSYVSVESTEASLSMDGYIYNVAGGIDYKFNDRGVAGVSLGFEHVDIDSTFNTGTYKSDGIALAPYIGYSLTPNWSVDFTAGYVWLDFDTTRNNEAVKGTFEGGRWFGAANLTGNYAVNRWRLSPKVGVLYLNEEHDAYTESGSSTAQVESDTIKIGRASAGLKVGYAFDNFLPYGKITGEWDFEHPDSVLKSNGQMSNDEDFGANLAVGVDIFKGPVSGTVEASYNSALREDLDVWQATARIRYQF